MNRRLVSTVGVLLVPALVAALSVSNAAAQTPDAEEETLTFEPDLVTELGPTEFTITAGGFTPGVTVFLVDCIRPEDGTDPTAEDCNIEEVDTIVIDDTGGFTRVKTVDVVYGTMIVASTEDQSEQQSRWVFIDLPEKVIATPTFSTPIAVGDTVEFLIEVEGFDYPQPGLALYPCIAPGGDLEAIDKYANCDIKASEYLDTDNGHDAFGNGSRTVSFFMRNQNMAILAYHDEDHFAAVAIDIAPQSFTVDPAFVTEPGQQTLTATGTGWTPGNSLFMVPCVAPDGDARALVGAEDCEVGNLTAVTVGSNGGFTATGQYDIGENFALAIGDAAQTETFAVVVPILEPAMCEGLVATHQGTAGADLIRGTNGPDVIVAGAGNDRIVGYGGDDIICTGDGNDRVFAGAGNDTILGEGGVLKARGGAGDDTIVGGDYTDFLKGGDGDDTIEGGDGQDLIRAGLGNDTLYGGPNRDYMWGGPGDDEIFGVSNDYDIVNGGDGDGDICHGYDQFSSQYTNCEILPAD